MTSPKNPKGTCQACNRSVPVADGKTSNHGSKRGRCPGSGNPPRKEDR